MIIENKTSIKNRTNFKLFYEKNNKNPSSKAIILKRDNP